MQNFRKVINEEIENFLKENPECNALSSTYIRSIIRNRKASVLYEGLIKSRSRFDVLRNIKTFSVRVNSFDKKRIHIIVENKNIIPFESQLDKLFDLLNVVGWYIAEFVWYVESNGQYVERNSFSATKESIKEILLIKPYEIEMILEPKFDEEISSIPHKLYHAAPAIYRDRIKLNGLRPSSGSKMAYHPERVYFAFTVDAAISLLKELYKYSPKRNDSDKTEYKFDDGLYDIYEFDAKKHNTLKLFADPNFNFGCFTLDNIDPHHLKIIKEVDIKQK